MDKIEIAEMVARGINGQVVNGYVSELHAHAAFEGEFRMTTMRDSKNKKMRYIQSVSHFNEHGLFSGITCSKSNSRIVINVRFPGELKKHGKSAAMTDKATRRERYLEMVKYYHSVSPLPLSVYLDAIDLADQFLEYYFDEDGNYSPYKDEYLTFQGTPKRVSLNVRYIVGELSYVSIVTNRSPNKGKEEFLRSTMVKHASAEDFYKRVIKSYVEAGVISDQLGELYLESDVVAASVNMLVERRGAIRSPEQRHKYLLELAMKNSPELVEEHAKATKVPV